MSTEERILVGLERDKALPALGIPNADSAILTSAQHVDAVELGGVHGTCRADAESDHARYICLRRKPRERVPLCWMRVPTSILFFKS